LTILCELGETAVAGIAPALGGAVRVAANLPEAAIGIVEDEAENLVVIGPDAPLDQVLDFTGKVLSERPELNVILMRHDYDPAAISAALRVGIREVVAASEPANLVEACRRVVATSARENASLAAEILRSETPQFESVPPAAALSTPTLAKIITVFSPKGGSGKTTIATNLAVALSEMGTTVCLVDLDLEFGDVAISLGLTPARTLGDAVKTQAVGDDDDALRMLITEYRPGLDCILAPIEPGAAEKIPAELISDLLTLLRSRYGCVVVDTPSQFSELVLAALDVSDHHVLLANPELPSLKSLRLTLDMLDLLHYPRERRSVVFNRADAASGLTADEAVNAIKFPITIEVPASRDVPASINRGVPIVAARADHAVSVAIRRFAAERIIGEPVGGKKRGRRGILRKRAT
jgi:MinD-like ATPase involved in chromosome partitioning or flagellar assembly